MYRCRRIYHWLSYSAVAGAEVDEEDFARFTEKLRHLVSVFSTRHCHHHHRVPFAVTDGGGGDDEGSVVSVAPLSLLATSQLRLTRRVQHSSAMRDLQRIAAAARTRVQSARDRQRQASPTSEAYRRAAQTIHETEDSHRGVLVHDFTRVHTTLRWTSPRKHEQLLVCCVLCLMAKCLPQIQLRFYAVDNPRAGVTTTTHMQALRNDVRNEMCHCAYAETHRECTRRRNTRRTGRRRQQRRCEWRADICQEVVAETNSNRTARRAPQSRNTRAERALRPRLRSLRGSS